MPDLRVKFEFNGLTFDLGLEESYALVQAVLRAQAALKVQCPTCRCKIYPGRECDCCASAVVDAAIDELLETDN